MLVQRLRRWTNIKPTLLQHLVSAGIHVLHVLCDSVDVNFVCYYVKAV